MNLKANNPSETTQMYVIREDTDNPDEAFVQPLTNSKNMHSKNKRINKYNNLSIGRKWFSTHSSEYLR